MAIRRLAWIAWLCGVAQLSLPAEAFVPRSHRVIQAVAKANVKGRRVGALRFNLELHIGDGPAVASGELVTHPTGMARLELRAKGGLVERHILQGDRHSASRNARLLVRPRAFLPPLFVLQSNSSAVLDAALVSLGVESEWIGLAPCGQDDCFVLGDPDRDVRGGRARIEEQPSGEILEDPGAVATAPDPEQAGEAVGAGDNAGDNGDVNADGDPDPGPDPIAMLWVQTQDFAIRRFELANGVKIELGPYVSFERISVPQWWSIEEPGKRKVLFEVNGVVGVNAPAAAFSRSWLMAPVVPPETTTSEEESVLPRPSDRSLPTNP